MTFTYLAVVTNYIHDAIFQTLVDHLVQLISSQPQLLSLSGFESHSFRTAKTTPTEIRCEGGKQTAQPPPANCSNKMKQHIMDLIPTKQANKCSVLLRRVEQSNQPNFDSCELPHNESSGDAAPSVKA